MRHAIQTEKAALSQGNVVDLLVAEVVPEV